MSDSNWASTIADHEARIAALENSGTCPPPQPPTGNILHQTFFGEHPVGTTWGETGQWNKIRSYHPTNNDFNRRYGNPGDFDAWHLTIGSQLSIVYDDKAGSNVLKLVYGENDPNPNINLIKHLGEGVDRVHIRYEMRFSNNWMIAQQHQNMYQKLVRAWKKVEDLTIVEYDNNMFQKWASEDDKHAAFGSMKSFNVNGTYLPAWNCTHMWKEELGNTVGGPHHVASFSPYADGKGYVDDTIGAIDSLGRLTEDQEYHMYEWWFDSVNEMWGLDIDGVPIPDATQQAPKNMQHLPQEEQDESSNSTTNKLFTGGGKYNYIRCFDNSSGQEYGEAGAMFCKSITIADGPIGV